MVTALAIFIACAILAFLIMSVYGAASRLVRTPEVFRAWQAGGRLRDVHHDDIA